MLKYQQYTEIKQITTKQLEEIVCDICGDVCKSRLDYNYDWYNHSWHINCVTLELNEGTNYPEGGDKTKTTCDICPKCFSTKLQPWLESQGVKMRQEEYDW